MFFFSKIVQTVSGTHPASYSMCFVVLALGLKWPGHEVTHVPPSSDVAKNKWSYTSALPVYLHGVDRDNCTPTFV
jgi:hypothetical protein